MSIDSDYQHVLRIVSSWPPEQRETLAHDVLETLKHHATGLPKQTLQRALGLARGNAPPPSDDDVKRWIHEHRLEKYG